MTNYQMLIGGKRERGGESMQLLNPANQQVLGTVSNGASAEDAERGPSRRRPPHSSAWSRLTGVERGNVLRRWANLVDQHMLPPGGDFFAGRGQAAL